MKSRKLLALTLIIITAVLLVVAIPVFALKTDEESDIAGISDVNIVEDDPLLRVEYCTLSLESDVHIMYAIKSDSPSLKLLTWTSAQDSYTLGTEESVLESLSERTEINGEMYTVFKFMGFSAKQMTDEIYVRACIEDVNGNITYGKPHKYSILQYAYNKLGKTAASNADEKLVKTLTAMLEYGAASQEQFAYKTDRLATDEWVQVKLSDGTLPDGFNKGLYRIGTSVTLTAPEKNADGEIFKHWEDGNGNTVSDVREFNLTVGSENAVYTPVYVPLYTRDGNYIYFGSYPQSEVTDLALESELNTLAGELPANGASKSWTSYKYYNAGSNETDFMWYIDISYGNERYRGVYFDQYKWYTTTSWHGDPASHGNYQLDYGYSKDEVYWFKYEPIKWQIIKESNGFATLLCEMLLDTHTFCDTHGTTQNGQSIEGHNYKYSSVRSWLNDNFYNTAFDELQKEILPLTTVDNSTASTGNQYSCENTNDYVWLLSYKESLSVDNSKSGTDYAKCQGLNPYNPAWQWSRSPSAISNGMHAYSINGENATQGFTDVRVASFGLRPIVRIIL